MRGNYMLKLNNEDLIFLLTINNNSKSKEITHLTTKMAVINDSVENTLSNIAQGSGLMNLDSLNIYYIIPDENLEFEYLQIDNPSKIVYIEVGIKYFMENVLDNPQYDFWKHNKNTLYILKGGNYSYLKDLFTVVQEEKVNIVRGSSQKSHIVSPIDFRLSCYLMILYNMNYNKVASNNSFNLLTKNRYLPSFD